MALLYELLMSKGSVCSKIYLRFPLSLLSEWKNLNACLVCLRIVELCSASLSLETNYLSMHVNLWVCTSPIWYRNGSAGGNCSGNWLYNKILFVKENNDETEGNGFDCFIWNACLRMFSLVTTSRGRLIELIIAS